MLGAHTLYAVHSELLKFAAPPPPRGVTIIANNIAFYRIIANKLLASGAFVCGASLPKTTAPLRSAGLLSIEFQRRFKMSKNERGALGAPVTEIRDFDPDRYGCVYQINYPFVNHQNQQGLRRRLDRMNLKDLKDLRNLKDLILVVAGELLGKSTIFQM